MFLAFSRYSQDEIIFIYRNVCNILSTGNSIINHKYKIHNDFRKIIHEIQETKYPNSNTNCINEIFLSLLLIYAGLTYIFSICWTDLFQL